MTLLQQYALLIQDKYGFAVLLAEVLLVLLILHLTVDLFFKILSSFRSVTYMGMLIAIVAIVFWYSQPGVIKQWLVAQTQEPVIILTQQSPPVASFWSFDEEDS